MILCVKRIYQAHNKDKTVDYNEDWQEKQGGRAQHNGKENVKSEIKKERGEQREKNKVSIYSKFLIAEISYAS